MKHLRIAAELSDTISPDNPNYDLALVNKGNALANLAELGVNSIQNLQQAEKLYLSALEIFGKSRDRINTIKTLENIGILYYRSGDYEGAYDVLKRL